MNWQATATAKAVAPGTNPQRKLNTGPSVYKADAVQEKDDGTLPTGCYRQQEAEYRLLHSKSSYVWYFNVAVNGQSDPNSEPVCQGKAKRSWHMCSYSRQ